MAKEYAMVSPRTPPPPLSLAVTVPRLEIDKGRKVSRTAVSNVTRDPESENPIPVPFFQN